LSRVRGGAVALALLAGLFALHGGATAADFSVPRLSGLVVDLGGFLGAPAEQQLSAALIKLKAAGGGTEIAVLTVADLGGSTIEQASIQVVDAWKLGAADKDNGVLVMLARDERQVRIEVGQGLEGNLPDAHAKRIVDETMVPLLRSGNAEQAILLGAYQVAQRTNPDLALEAIFGAGSQKWSQRSRSPGGLGALIPLVFIVLFVLMGRGRGGRGRAGGLATGVLLGGMMGGGRGGRGGFLGGSRGGSFGGGGGGFSGGGASGGW
jgi:uncharacterized protein